MPSMEGHFRLLRNRLEPNAEKAKTAQEMPGKVREHLRKHPEFATETPHTRLGGSYGRRTAITNIKDVDILVFVDQEWRDKPISELMDALYKALKELPETLGEGYTPELRRQRRSINVYLPESELSLDIVPVLKTTDSHEDQLEVPDKEWDEWVFTQPLGYSCFLSDLNGDNNGKVVPAVKMMKHWRDVQFQKMRPKSYWLEAIVVRHIRREWVTTKNKGDAELMRDIFASLHEKFTPILKREEDTPYIPDPMLRNPVAWNWKRSAFETFMNRLDEARKDSQAAINAKTEEEAERAWKRVFGDDWFPSKAEVEEEYKSLGAMSAAGQLSVTPTGRVLPQAIAAVASVASVVSPQKRFFGGC